MKLTKAALQRKKIAEDEVLIPANAEQQRRFDAAKKELETRQQAIEFAQLSSDEAAEGRARLRADEARIALEAMKDEIRKTGTAITLRGVGRLRFDEIQREHPATDEMRTEDKDKPEEEQRTWDPATFWPALLAETAESDLKPEDWRVLVFESKEWSQAEIDVLKFRASAVNQTSRIVELGN